MGEIILVKNYIFQNPRRWGIQDANPSNPFNIIIVAKG